MPSCVPLPFSQPAMATSLTLHAQLARLQPHQMVTPHVHTCFQQSVQVLCVIQPASWITPPPVRLPPQTPGNTTACQQSPSNTPSRTDGLPVPPRRLATGCGLLGASISWWNTELSPAEPQRWFLIWKRNRKAGKSLHPRSRLASFPLKRNALKLWTRMGTPKMHGESHCPVSYSLFPASSSNWQHLR